MAQYKDQALIGKNLRNLRESRGLTQKALGKALGITFQQIQKYEKGESCLSCIKLYALSQILQVPYECFFTGLDEPQRALPPLLVIHPAIMTRALKMQQHCSPQERVKILKIIDILTA